MDQTRDTHRFVYHRIEQRIDLPDYVKQASISDDYDSIPSSSFADPSRRRFPCHSRAHTSMSYAYYLLSPQDSHVEERFNKFAAMWNLENDFSRMKSQFAASCASDLDRRDDSDFALVYESDGCKHRSVPIFSADTVKRAAAHLIEFVDRYPMSWRRRMAGRIVKAAAQFDVSVDDRVAKMAAATPRPRLDIAYDLHRRVTTVHNLNPDVRVGMLKVAEAICKNRISAIDAASVIDQFDREYGIVCRYGEVETPEEICFSDRATKMARDVMSRSIKLSNGSTYDISSIASAGMKPFRVLGDDFVNAVSSGVQLDLAKLAEIVPTLPRDDAELLDTAMRSAGVKTLQSRIKASGLPDSIDEWRESDWKTASELVGAGHDRCSL